MPARVSFCLLCLAAGVALCYVEIAGEGQVRAGKYQEFFLVHLKCVVMPSELELELGTG